MRRRTFLLADGLLAYLFGATVRAYLDPEADMHFCKGVEYRLLAVAEHPRRALRHPALAAEFLLFRQGCYD